jgi:hypothetical protein
MPKNVSDEKMQILKMVEESKINAQEAMELMNALEGNQDNITPKNNGKWLKVRVKTMDDKDKVNVNIPISLVDVGLRLATAYAPDLKKSDFDQIDVESIIEAVQNGAEGKIVDVEDEENQTKVKVYVE